MTDDVIIYSVYFRRVLRVYHDGVGPEEAPELQKGVWQGVPATEGDLAVCVVEIEYLCLRNSPGSCRRCKHSFCWPCCVTSFP